MKNSTFLLLAVVMAAVTQMIKPSDHLFVAAFILISAFYICRAIEKNGAER